MAETEFVTYNGIKFRKFKGTEIGGTGHYIISSNDLDDITIAGTFLDVEENFNKLKEDFYNFIELRYLSYNKTSYFGYNHVLIGKDYLIPFLRNTSSYATTKGETDNLFDSVIDALCEIGYMNKSPTIVTEAEIPYIKFTLTDKENPKKNIPIYFIPLDNISIECSQVSIKEE